MIIKVFIFISIFIAIKNIVINLLSKKILKNLNSN